MESFISEGGGFYFWEYSSMKKYLYIYNKVTKIALKQTLKGRLDLTKEISSSIKQSIISHRYGHGVQTY